MNIKIKNRQVVGFAFIICTLAFSTMLTSCNNWLDVRPETEQKEEDQFSTEKGFEMALTGCYLQMASQSGYGLQMTMTSVENLADLWRINPNTTRLSERDLALHDYTTDNAKSTVKGIYTNLFKTIAQASLIIKNAKAMSEVLLARGVNLVSGGTDNHLMLIDLRGTGVTGAMLQERLDDVNITANKNTIPFDPEKPMVTSGVRIGTPAVTARGFKEEDCKIVAECIADCIFDYENKKADVIARVKTLTDKYPIYPDIK